MTQNQIAYAKHLEDKRTNLRNENLKQQQINVALAEIPIKQQQANASSLQAEVALVNSQTKQDELQWDKDEWEKNYNKEFGFKVIDGVVEVGSSLLGGGIIGNFLSGLTGNKSVRPKSNRGINKSPSKGGNFRSK